MKYLYSFILLLFVTSSGAQNNWKEKNDRAAEKVISLFNVRLTDSLYAFTNLEFKKNVDYRLFQDVLITHLYPLGKIKKRILEKYESGVSKYRVELDSGNLTMLISMDLYGKLSKYGFLPYKPEFSDTIAVTNSDNLKKTILDKKVDSIIQPFMFASKTVGLGIGILSKGKFYYYNYGSIKKGSTILPDNHSIYEIGSITKTFTGILLANAVVEKRMSLEDPVNKYLPKDIPLLVLGNDTMKVVHLSNHTSGLPRIPLTILYGDQANPYKNYDNEQLYAFLKNIKLLSRPGELSSYSNIGVGLLGVLLESVFGMSFETAVKHYITDKAGMTNTVQVLDSSNKLLQGYAMNGKAQQPWDFKALAGAGALRSNVKDMLLYARYNLGIGVKDEKQQRVLKISQTKTYEKDRSRIALNWFMRSWGNNQLFYHDGQTGGYKSFLAFNSRTQNAIVLLSSTAVSNDEEGFKLLDFLDHR